ncbi:MAG: translation initiation factor eIF-1A [Candidatus Aenigmarchaeota archaeon]|nr:translation initiation factor eIF-1A [Candidatus Aenigmarchaeota archaeon]
MFMEQQQGPVRVRLPRDDEIIGEVEEVLGASRFKVRCTDEKIRMCRIPGKFRKRINIRAGFIVLIKPWSIEPDEKGDVAWIYTKTQADWLRRKGYV